jgi:hypothetical protein
MTSSDRGCRTQVAFCSLEHSALPEEWLAWYPEATVNRISLDDVHLKA